jgi:hypothetical protein
MHYKFTTWFTAIYLLLFSDALFGQPANSPFDLHPPLSGELLLSGSFGEVRASSFHAGIDFRTDGKIGQEVFASEQGYISRIRVGGTGFGKAIYIQHPNGLTTVYAHLDRFLPEVENYVKEHQYKQKTFDINLWLKPSEFPVKRGELIAYSGNTGSSGGPHLHYEVRSTKNQIPLNPSFSNLEIKDNLKPVINGLWVYPIDELSYIHGINIATEVNVHQNKGSYFTTDTIEVQGVIGVGVKTYDYINKGSLRCGVYSIKKYVNNTLTYHFCVDQFSFAESRYATSHLDYALIQQSGKRVHQLFKDPNNRHSGFKSLVSNGRIHVKPDSIYNVSIEVADAYGHSSSIGLVLKGKNFEIKTPNSITIPTELSDPAWLFYNDNSKTTDWFSVFIPKNSLYDNIQFTYDVLAPIDSTFSPLIRIHNPNIALHRPYTLAIKADSVPDELTPKALIATQNGKGKIVSAGGKYTQGFVEAQVNFFGDFFITVDTIAPIIKPLNISNNRNMNEEASINFEVRDSLSGIASFEGAIDNNWVLFESDPKNNLLIYKFDSKRLEKNQKHNLKLRVTDHKDNVSEFSCSFYW